MHAPHFQVYYYMAYWQCWFHTYGLKRTLRSGIWKGTNIRS